MNVNERVRQRLKRIIEDKGLTPRRWSEEAGLGPNFLQQFLDGDGARSIRVDALEKLGRVVDMEPATLIGPNFSALQPELLAAVVQTAIRTIPESLADPDTLSRVCAATYEKALAYGIEPTNTEQLRFGIELLTRESLRR